MKLNVAAAFLLFQVMIGPTALFAQSCDASFCSGKSESCQMQCSAPCETWSGGVDAIFFSRSQNFSGGLVLDEDNPPAFALTGDALDFGFETGIRAFITRQLSAGETIEFVYFGIDEWAESATATGLNNRSLPGDAGLATFDFFNADAIEAAYRADITNMEINVRLNHQCFDCLLGFRYLELDESMTLASFDADTFSSDYRVATENDLFGGQLGLVYSRCCNNFNFAVTAKSGIYANSTGQDTLFRDASNTLTLRDVSRVDTVASSISELNLNTDIRLTQCISARLGYNLLWVTDLALAPYQLDFTDTASSSEFVNSDNSLFMHGAHAGVTVTF